MRPSTSLTCRFELLASECQASGIHPKGASAGNKKQRGCLLVFSATWRFYGRQPIELIPNFPEYSQTSQFEKPEELQLH
jgi:hypothetical protein